MKRSALALLLLIAAAPSRADDTAAFLKIGVGARPLGMGGAYTGIANDVNAIAWNPAGLAGVLKGEFGLTHAELAVDTRYDFLGYAQTTKHGTFGAGAGYLSHGAIPGRDENGQPTGGYTAADSVVSLGYASEFPDSLLRLGGSLKAVQSRIANVSGNTFAADLGLQREFELKGPGEPVLGVAVQNLGPGMKFADQTESLPLALTVGGGYRLKSGLTLAIDVKDRVHEHTTEVSFGTEYALFTSFSLRAGYESSGGGQGLTATGAAPAVSALNGFAAGFGLKVHSYNLDYSMTPFGDLGTVQRFSFCARW